MRNNTGTPAHVDTNEGLASGDGTRTRTVGTSQFIGLGISELEEAVAFDASNDFLVGLDASSGDHVLIELPALPAPTGSTVDSQLDVYDADDTWTKPQDVVQCMCSASAQAAVAAAGARRRRATVTAGRRWWRWTERRLARRSRTAFDGHCHCWCGRRGRCGCRCGSGCSRESRNCRGRVNFRHVPARGRRRRRSRRPQQYDSERRRCGRRGILSGAVGGAPTTHSS